MSDYDEEEYRYARSRAYSKRDLSSTRYSDGDEDDYDVRSSLWLCLWVGVLKG